MTETIRVALPGAATLVDGAKQSFPAGEFEVLVCRVQGVLYAVEDLCSHAQSKLCSGSLRRYVISCPLHSAQFDVRDGKHKSRPAFTGIRSFPITELSGDVQVEVPAQKPQPNFGGAAPLRPR